MVRTASVIMPVFNAERYIAKAIESILTQSYHDFEFIIIDDGSQDSSLRIVQAYQTKDQRVRVLTRPNTGMVGALNDGIALASGRYIVRMDADDIALRSRIQQQIGFLESNPAVVAVGTAVILIDEDGDEVCRTVASTDHTEIDQQLLLNEGSRICHPTVVMRTEIVRSIGGYRDKYRGGDDIDLFLRLGEVGLLANIATPLLQYRLHPHSMCHTRWHTEMLPRQRAAIREAYERRRIRPLPTARDDNSVMHVTMANPRIEYHRSCSYRAMIAGHGKVARKHAFAALRANPRLRRTWWTCGHALIGVAMMNRILKIYHWMRNRCRSAELTAKS